MAKNNQTSPSISYLVEIIIVILFFAISSAICVSVFTSAHNLSVNAVQRNEAIMKAQEVIETLKGKGTLESNKMYFDKDWKLVEHEDNYKMIINQEENNFVLSVYQKKEKITQVTFSFKEKVGDIHATK